MLNFFFLRKKIKNDSKKRKEKQAIIPEFRLANKTLGFKVKSCNIISERIICLKVIKYIKRKLIFKKMR